MQAQGIWSLRQRTYQCAGGSQSNFALGPNGVANCLNTPIGRLYGSYGNLGNIHSSNFYGTQDPTWCPMQPDCLNSFTYPWFPNVESPDKGNWLGGTFVPPQPGLKMFRLPNMYVSSRTCTPSPFVNATRYGNSSRPAYVSWNGIVPTQCGSDNTLSITDLVGPGYYTAPLGVGASAALLLGGVDNNTVTCAWTLGTSLPIGLQVLNVTIVVTDGPVYASDDPLYTGNPSSPYWQIGFLNVSGIGSPLTGAGSALLSRALNNSAARPYTRVVDCVVDGVNYMTGLPFTLKAAQPYVVEGFGQGWLPYSYPMPGNYTPPCVAPAPAAPSTIGFSVLSPISESMSNAVGPGNNTLSAYAAAVIVINYDVTAGLAGGWDATNLEYVAPSTGWVRGDDNPVDFGSDVHSKAHPSNDGLR